MIRQFFLKNTTMLSVIIFAVCVGFSSQQVTLPHGHTLAQMVDTAFNWLDTNDDGILSLQEVSSVAAKEDLNNDGMITLAEYAKFLNGSEADAKPRFDVYDKDGNGSIPTNYLVEFIHIMDTNGDGIVNMHEFEHYEVRIIQCVYGQHGHGHATHGHAATCLSRR